MRPNFFHVKYSLQIWGGYIHKRRGIKLYVKMWRTDAWTEELNAYLLTKAYPSQVYQIF